MYHVSAAITYQAKAEAQKQTKAQNGLDMVECKSAIIDFCFASLLFYQR